MSKQDTSKLPMSVDAAPSQPTKTARPVPTSSRNYQIFGFICLGLLVGGVGGWTAYASVASAVIAPGNVVVSSNSKKVQHVDGGIVSRIFVKDGDRVEAGALLLRLDDTETRSNLTIARRQLVELRAQAARNSAERAGMGEGNKGDIAFPDDLRQMAAKFGMNDVLNGQKDLLKRRIDSLENRGRQLDQRVEQFNEQISGLIAQRKAVEKQVAFIVDELQDARLLREQGLLRKTRLLELERNKARLLGERGKLISEIATTKVKITETRERKLQLASDMVREAETELGEARAKIAELEQKVLQASTRLDRVTITSPQAGIIDKLAVHTVGGVVAAGDPVMYIVPVDDKLVIEARVGSQNIDEVRSGQAATIRLGSFDADETPELAAKVIYISADVTASPEGTFAPFYKIRLELGLDEVKKLNGQDLVPGMPADVFLQTGERTVLAYLLKPFKDQLARTFK